MGQAWEANARTYFLLIITYSYPEDNLYAVTSRIKEKVRLYATCTCIWGVDMLRGQRLGGMFTMLPHKQSCACATWGEAAWCQQFCWVSNALQNFLCYSDCSSVTSIILIAHKAPGTDHANTVLQFRLAVSHPFYKPPTKPLVQTTVIQCYSSDWQCHIHSINLPQSPWYRPR